MISVDNSITILSTKKGRGTGICPLLIQEFLIHYVLTGFPDCPGSPMGPREPGKPYNTKESDNKGITFCK